MLWYGSPSCRTPILIQFFFTLVFSAVSSSQSKPSLSNSNSVNVGGKAMNSIKKAVAIKSDSEEAKPLVATATSNGRQVVLE